MRRIAHTLTICVLLFMHLGLPGAGQQDAGLTQRKIPKLEVTLSVDKATFLINETIPVHVRITNSGSEPILIGNNVFLGGGAANLEMTLEDAAGRVCRQTQMTHDFFPSQVRPDPSTILLKFWMLLRPGNSLTTSIEIGSGFLSCLGTPGRYTLSANYYSNGFSYPTYYRTQGLTDEDVRSIPFACWHGKIATSTVQFKIIARSARAPGGRD